MQQTHQGEETDKGIIVIYDAVESLNKRRYELRDRFVSSRSVLIRYYKMFLSNSLPDDYVVENYKDWSDDIFQPSPPVRFKIYFDHDIKNGDYMGKCFRVEFNNWGDRK